jgi:hypothetical protein
MPTPVQPSVPLSGDEDPVFECYRYRVDGDVELHVAHLADSERMVASLRLEPVATAPLRTLRHIGARVLPGADGAYVHLAADPDEVGAAGLAAVVASAMIARRHEADDAFWIAACPAALLHVVLAHGWRALSIGPADPARTSPVALLLDDRERFARLRSPLACATAQARPGRLGTLLEAFGLEPDGPAASRHATG